MVTGLLNANDNYSNNVQVYSEYYVPIKYLIIKNFINVTGQDEKIEYFLHFLSVSFLPLRHVSLTVAIVFQYVNFRFQIINR